MRRRFAAAVGVALLVSCGGDDGDGADGGEEAAPTTTAAPAATTSSSSTTTAPEPPDPFTIPEDPADIDEAYVEAVINEHNRVIGDALRIQLDGGDPQEVIDRYNAIYVPEVADALLTSAFNVDDRLIESLRDPLGNQLARVMSLRVATPGCIAAIVEQDLSLVFVEPPPPTENVVVLRTREDGPGTDDLNATDWLSEGLVPLDAASGTAC